jgi:hypothetical protein
MSRISIEALGPAVDRRGDLHEALSSAGFAVEQVSQGVRIPVTTLTDCRKAGRHVASFVSDNPGTKLRIDGPGGTATLHRLGQDDDEEIISGYLATCAYLQ